MKLYKHTGHGHCLGSVIIVWAGSLNTAKKLIRETLDDCGLKDEELQITCVGTLESFSTVIYSDDGDY